MLVIDGAKGEGGGQIIRTSLALSLITGRDFRIVNIRAGREKGGLRPQHLTSVQAAALIGSAEVKGAEVGSRQLTFRPGKLAPGSYTFRIGTAGSTMLVLQTILPPLMLAEKPSFIEFEGGTHNTHAPPFDFVANTFVPLLQRMGVEIKLQMERYGFYPPGGGRVQAKIIPAPRLAVLNLSEAKQNIHVTVRSLVVKLPEHIGERENNLLKNALSDYPLQTKVETSGNALSPGNVVFVEIANQHFTETVSSIGERGLRAEVVAQAAADEALAYLQSNALVGQHLADQLLLPFALAGGGEFRTNALTEHTTTNIEVIRNFLDINIRVAPAEDNTWRISFGS
jgi:RNA 3'-terminal phosphate cyclase (ATP)